MIIPSARVAVINRPDRIRNIGDLSIIGFLATYFLDVY